MATLETFHGPWRITLGYVNPIPPKLLFVVRGSDNADGGYIVEPRATLDVSVSGAEWTIGLGYAEGSTFFDDTQRSTKFELQNGLIVVLNSPIAIFTLICISMDPETNPIPTHNPYDFTIPGG